MSVKFQDFKDKQSIRKLETKIGAAAFNFSSAISISKMAVLPMLPVQSIKNRTSVCRVLSGEYTYENPLRFSWAVEGETLGLEPQERKETFYSTFRVAQL